MRAEVDDPDDTCCRFVCAALHAYRLVRAWELLQLLIGSAGLADAPPVGIDADDVGTFFDIDAVGDREGRPPRLVRV
jgi:hypothetical protein